MAKKTEINETPETSEQNQEQPGIVESVLETISETASSFAEAITSVSQNAAEALGLTSETDANQPTENKISRRSQKIGTVSSDKMTKTVVVNVDRKVMHPKYRRYVRRTSKFMAHDEMETVIGDKVRIEETRPMSARKRWRVIEIIQKAAK